MLGRPARGGREWQPNNSLIITRALTSYSHENLAWLCKIDAIVRRPRTVLGEVRASERAQWLERFFGKGESARELAELVQYYKYYQSTPLLAAPAHFHFMNNYWTRSKTVYYMRVKRILQIDQDSPQQTLERNISNQEYSRTDCNDHTFYVMPHICFPRPSSTQDNTLERILSSLQRKGSDLRGRTIKDIDKAYKFPQESKTKDRHSQQKSHLSQKSHLKTNPSHLVSQFTFTKPKRKKQNHKSLSNQAHSQQRVSKGKKLTTTSSCMNMNSHESNLNYLRRDRNNLKSQKELKTKKRETSQINLLECRHRQHQSKSKPSHQPKASRCWNEVKVTYHQGKGSHKKAASNERSSSAGLKSKSGKKRLDTQTNVKAVIDKTKNKIKMQKSIMLKKYVQSRQSYTKSIDSTCGEVGRLRK